jgi:hypothetical protein
VRQPNGVHPLTAGTSPSADFWPAINDPGESPSPNSAPEQPDRSPAISSTTFNARPPDLRSAPLMDQVFEVNLPAGSALTPHIRFLFIGLCLCLPLLSDPASRRRPWVRRSLSSIRLDRDLDPEAVKHARHTNKSGLTLANQAAPYLTQNMVCLDPGIASCEVNRNWTPPTLRCRNWTLIFMIGDENVFTVLGGIAPRTLLSFRFLVIALAGCHSFRPTCLFAGQQRLD